MALNDKLYYCMKCEAYHSANDCVVDVPCLGFPQGGASKEEVKPPMGAVSFNDSNPLHATKKPNTLKGLDI